jgi:hypothetical protein
VEDQQAADDRSGEDEEVAMQHNTWKAMQISAMREVAPICMNLILDSPIHMKAARIPKLQGHISQKVGRIWVAYATRRLTILAYKIRKGNDDFWIPGRVSPYAI